MGTTLDDAQREMWARALTNKGTTCPCCTQFVKIYKRPVNQSQGRSLICLYKFFSVNPDEWLHIPKYLADRHENRNNDIGLTRHWGLLEEMDVRRDDGAPHAGMYRMTEFGFKFVTRQISIPKYAFLYDSDLLGLSDGVYAPLESITIDEATSDEGYFHYLDLMQS